MKITFVKILKYFLPLLITNIFILSVFYYWFSDDISIFTDNKFVFGLILIIAIPFIPQFIVLFNHYTKNKDTYLAYNDEFIYVHDKEIKIEINKQNIRSWQLVATATKSKRSSYKFTLIDDLFYIKVILDNNDSIVLTSLLCPQIEKLFMELFNSYRIENKIISFPLIK